MSHRVPLLAVKDRTNGIVPTLSKNSELQQFIFENSSIRAMTLCGHYNSCWRVICPWCSACRAKAARARLAPGA